MYLICPLFRPMTCVFHMEQIFARHVQEHHVVSAMLVLLLTLSLKDDLFQVVWLHLKKEKGPTSAIGPHEDWSVTETHKKTRYYLNLPQHLRFQTDLKQQ